MVDPENIVSPLFKSNRLPIANCQHLSNVRRNQWPRIPFEKCPGSSTEDGGGTTCYFNHRRERIQQELEVSSFRDTFSDDFISHAIGLAYRWHMNQEDNAWPAISDCKCQVCMAQRNGFLRGKGEAEDRQIASFDEAHMGRG